MELDVFLDSVKRGDLPAIKAALAEESSLLTAKNAAGQTAILLAKYYRQPEVSEYLLSLQPELDIFEAAVVGDLAAVNRHLNVDPSLLNAHNSDGWTPLHLAAFFGAEQVADALIFRGAVVNATSTNRMQNTPLHAAVAGGQTSLVELLLKNGADVKTTQLGGWTALHGAAQSGYREMAEILLAHSADPRARADNNQNALDLALLNGKTELVSLLEKFEPSQSEEVN